MASSVASPKEADLNAKLVTDFIHFVHAESRDGVDIAENRRHYCPISAIRRYWTTTRITAVLFSLPNLVCDAAVIRKDYLCTFSTVVYSNRVGNIGDFIRLAINDEKLPLTKPHEEWPAAEYYESLFKKIFENQWMFFPLRFRKESLQQRTLPDRRILPISNLEQICHSSIADVQKVEIDDDYNELVPLVWNA
jgi:hypothetical protein